MCILLLGILELILMLIWNKLIKNTNVVEVFLKESAEQDN